MGPVQGQGLKIQLFTLMEQSSAKGEAGRSEGPWNLGGGGNQDGGKGWEDPPPHPTPATPTHAAFCGENGRIYMWETWSVCIKTALSR